MKASQSRLLYCLLVFFGLLFAGCASPYREATLGTPVLSRALEQPPASEGAIRVKVDPVHFGYDNATLSPAAKRLIERVAVLMKLNPALYATVQGHTCGAGSAEYNQALGQKRAEAVRQHLLSRRVRPERVRAMSFGESRALAGGVSEAGAADRRVEIIIHE